jgi:hypothetical protein
LATRFTLRYELRLSTPRRLSRRKESVQLGCDEFRKRSFARLEQRHDRRALRFDVPPENFARDAAEVDAEVFDLRSVGNRKIGAHPDQKLVQRQALGPKRYDVTEVEPREAAQLARLRNGRVYVFRPEDRTKGK